MDDLTRWKEFLTVLLERGYAIKLKGGSAFGLYILQQVLHRGDPSLTSTHYKHTIRDLEWFLLKETNLNFFLIKDWDFVIFNENPAQVYTNITNLCLHYYIRNEASTMYVLRTHDRLEHPQLKVNNAPLMELAIKPMEDYSDWELPMTTMTFTLSHDNITPLFNVINFFLRRSLEVEEMSSALHSYFRFMETSHSHIPQCIHGVFNTRYAPYSNNYEINPEAYVSYGRIGRVYDGRRNLKQCIEELPNDPLYYDPLANQMDHGCFYTHQFIISQMMEPDRLFIRLRFKNMRKAQIVCDEFEVRGYAWIPDVAVITAICTTFFERLQHDLTNIYGTYYPQIFSSLGIITELKVGLAETRAERRIKQQAIDREINSLDMVLIQYIEELGYYYDGVNIGRLLNQLHVKSVTRYLLPPLLLELPTGISRNQVLTWPEECVLNDYDLSGEAVDMPAVKRLTLNLNVVSTRLNKIKFPSKLSVNLAHLLKHQCDVTRDGCVKFTR